MKTYLVGGAVRDELLQRPVNDRDYVVTGASVEHMLNLGYQQVGADFPVFLHPQTKQEHALARTERKSGQGYKGFSVDFNPQVTLEDDLLRRDLTINAIAKDENGNYVDPYGGLADIERRVIRHVSEAFVEDPLRVLRVARFAAQLESLDFTVHQDTVALMNQLAQSGELSHLTPERVFKETEKALCSPSPETFFQVLDSSSALTVLFSEFSSHNLDVALSVLSHATKLSENPEVRWAALVNNIVHSEQAPEVITALNQRLKVPNRYSILAQKVAQLSSSMTELLSCNEQNVLSLLMKLDAFRRPELLQDFVTACQAIMTDESSDEQPFHEGLLLLEAYKICSQVIAKSFVQQGHKGIAIKQMIEQKRLLLLSQLIPSSINVSQDDD